MAHRSEKEIVKASKTGRIQLDIVGLKMQMEKLYYDIGKKVVVLNQKKKHKKFHGYIFDKCLPLCVVSMSTAMVQRALFDSVGLFDETLLCCEDYDFWLRIWQKHKLHFIHLFVERGRWCAIFKL